MNKPTIKNWKAPDSINSYPLGATCDSNHIISKNSGWRVFRPVINTEKCIRCLKCYLVCPDGVIDKTEENLKIDYDFCKGCGICAYECKFNAIEMIRESDMDD